MADDEAMAEIPTILQSGGEDAAAYDGRTNLAPPSTVAQRNASLRAIMRIPVTLKVVVGCATLPIAELTALGRGSLVPLDRQADDKVDVVANGRVIARGHVVVIDGEASRFAVSIDEIVGQQQP